MKRRGPGVWVQMFKARTEPDVAPTRDTRPKSRDHPRLATTDPRPTTHPHSSPIARANTSSNVGTLGRRCLTWTC